MTVQEDKAGRSAAPRSPRAGSSRSPSRPLAGRRLGISQLTDVLPCKLHQYLRETGAEDEGRLWCRVGRIAWAIWAGKSGNIMQSWPIAVHLHGPLHAHAGRGKNRPGGPLIHRGKELRAVGSPWEQPVLRPRRRPPASGQGRSWCLCCGLRHLTHSGSVVKNFHKKNGFPPIQPSRQQGCVLSVQCPGKPLGTLARRSRRQRRGRRLIHAGCHLKGHGDKCARDAVIVTGRGRITE